MDNKYTKISCLTSEMMTWNW